MPTTWPFARIANSGDGADLAVVPAQAKLRGWCSRAPWSAVLIALLCIWLAEGISDLNWAFVGHPEYEARLEHHEEILAGEAYMPYQWHGYLAAQACQALHDHRGISLYWAFFKVMRAGYWVLLFGSWYLFAQVFRGAFPVIAGLVVVALYAVSLMHCSYDHPADTYATGLFAITLGCAQRRKLAGVVVTALAAGFLWTKGVLAGPVVFLFYAMERDWRRAIVGGLLTALAASVGPLIYGLTLGHHPLVPDGVLSEARRIESIPFAMRHHVVFSGFPILCILTGWRRTPRIILAGLAVYPLLVGLYAVNCLFLWEMRSFWMTVPALAGIIIAWAQTHSRGGPAGAATEAAGLPEDEAFDPGTSTQDGRGNACRTRSHIHAPEDSG